MRLVLFILVLLAPAAAVATPEFPTAINGELQLDYFPPCTICHQTDVGGAGTVVRPFGTAMIARGLKPNDQDTLFAALAAMEDDAVDSDRDGVGDVDELRNATDPNGPGAFSGPSPIYGCGGGRIAGNGAPRSPAGVLVGLFSLVAALTAVATRRRGRSSE